MIIDAFIGLIVRILDTIWIVEIPGLPESVNGAFDTFLSYVEQAVGFLCFFIPQAVINLIGVLGGIYLAAVIVYDGYLLVMWVLRKIPVLGIS